MIAEYVSHQVDIVQALSSVKSLVTQLIVSVVFIYFIWMSMTWYISSKTLSIVAFVSSQVLVQFDCLIY